MKHNHFSEKVDYCVGYKKSGGDLTDYRYRTLKEGDEATVIKELYSKGFTDLFIYRKETNTTIQKISVKEDEIVELGVPPYKIKNRRK